MLECSQGRGDDSFQGCPVLLLGALLRHSLPTPYNWLPVLPTYSLVPLSGLLVLLVPFQMGK